MPTVKQLFKNQLKDNLRKRKEKLQSITGSKPLIDAIDKQLSSEIKLPGEVRGQFKKYLDQEALSEVIETKVGKSKGWAIKISEEPKYLVMYYADYKGHMYLDFNTAFSIAK